MEIFHIMIKIKFEFTIGLIPEFQLNDLSAFVSKFLINICLRNLLSWDPLLFLFYVNDLPKCLNNYMPAIYANDTNLSVTGTSAVDIELKLNSELELVRDWLIANKLTLNVKKPNI